MNRRPEILFIEGLEKNRGKTLRCIINFYQSHRRFSIQFQEFTDFRDPCPWVQELCLNQPGRGSWPPSKTPPRSLLSTLLLPGDRHFCHYYGRISAYTSQLSVEVLLFSWGHQIWSLVLYTSNNLLTYDGTGQLTLSTQINWVPALCSTSC